MPVLPIVVSGSIAIDRIMRFNGRYRDYINTDRLNSLSVSIFLEEQTDTRGGVGANICYTLALLGDKPVLLGSVGPDADAYMLDLAEKGVDVSKIHTSHLPTAAFNVITDSEHNQVGGFYPGAMNDASSLTFQTWKSTDAIAVVAPHDPAAMRRQVAECKELGLQLFYDIGQQVSNTDGESMREGISAAQLILVNEYEMGILAEKTGLSPDEICQTVPIVVVTHGENGSVVSGKDMPQPITVGIARPKLIADPTGAGDAYRAGFLYGLARNWAPQLCAQLGAVTASFAIEVVGTQVHACSYAEVAKRYTSTFHQDLPPFIT